MTHRPNEAAVIVVYNKLVETLKVLIRCKLLSKSATVAVNLSQRFIFITELVSVPIHSNASDMMNNDKETPLVERFES